MGKTIENICDINLKKNKSKYLSAGIAFGYMVGFLPGIFLAIPTYYLINSYTRT